MGSGKAPQPPHPSLSMLSWVWVAPTQVRICESTWWRVQHLVSLRYTFSFLLTWSIYRNTCMETPTGLCEVELCPSPEIKSVRICGFSFPKCSCSPLFGTNICPGESPSAPSPTQIHFLCQGGCPQQMASPKPPCLLLSGWAQPIGGPVRRLEGGGGGERLGYPFPHSIPALVL